MNPLISLNQKTSKNMMIEVGRHNLPQRAIAKLDRSALFARKTAFLQMMHTWTSTDAFGQVTRHVFRRSKLKAYQTRVEQSINFRSYYEI